MNQGFKELFEDLFFPVVICQNTKDLPVIYINKKAKLLLSPDFSPKDLLIGYKKNEALDSILHFKTEHEFLAFYQRVVKDGHIDNYQTDILPVGRGILPVSISGTTLSLEKSSDYFIFYFIASSAEEQNKYNKEFASIVNSLFFIEDPNDAINLILARAGEIMKVCRAYIFEEISETTTRNTYEWCAPGVEPAIQDLQELKKADYNYNLIVQSGSYVTDDIAALPDEDRKILDMQGIKSLAIITIYNNKKPLGYVGFDDCQKTRKWDYEQMLFLKNISSFITTLIRRRKSDEKLQDSFSLMQLISDNSESLVYVSSLNDYKLLFVNKPLADKLNKYPNELIGQPCYKALERNENGPCSFCPIPKINWNPEDPQNSPVYDWTLQDDKTGKSYMIKDSVIKWIDESYTHIETAIDISERVQYESKLKYHASTDILTGFFNRVWGQDILLEKFEKKRINGSLCFIDLDDLKYTNDTYGHIIGDEMIREFARTIKESVPAESFTCRWGGDEFLLWLNMSVGKAEKTIHNIQHIMDEYNKQNGKTFKLAFSYGIMPLVKTDKNSTLDHLIAETDRAMYENKMQKRLKL